MRVMIFVLASAFFLHVSRKSIRCPRSHGFYRFFAWEAILALVLLNHPHWFIEPFAPLQLLSWGLLIVSIFLVVQGVYLLQVVGRPNQDRRDVELLAFEKTSSLVTVGIYRYIRHPLYSSLLFLDWGAFCKHLSWPGLLLAACSSIFLFLTAVNDEAECLHHFGPAYQTYMQDTKRFVPFLF